MALCIPGDEFLQHFGDAARPPARDHDPEVVLPGGAGRQ